MAGTVDTDDQHGGRPATGDPGTTSWSRIRKLAVLAGVLAAVSPILPWVRPYASGVGPANLFDFEIQLVLAVLVPSGVAVLLAVLLWRRGRGRLSALFVGLAGGAMVIVDAWLLYALSGGGGGAIAVHGNALPVSLLSPAVGLFVHLVAGVLFAGAGLWGLVESVRGE